MQSQYVEYPNTPQETAEFDQIQTSVENLGKLMGTYYLSLRQSGIPKPLASELTLDYQQFVLSRMPDGD